MIDEDFDYPDDRDVADELRRYDEIAFWISKESE